MPTKETTTRRLVTQDDVFAVHQKKAQLKNKNNSSWWANNWSSQFSATKEFDFLADAQKKIEEDEDMWILPQDD